MATAAAGTGGARRPRRTLLVGAGVAVVALALGGAWFTRTGFGRRTPTLAGPVVAAPKRIAVLPFENLGSAEDGYFADGMTDEVRSKLSGLTVIASVSSGQYRATTKSPEQIARELGVGWLPVAKVRWQKTGSASRIRVTPELVEVGGGGAPTTRWQEAFDADLSDVFKVQGEIAANVARALNVVLSGSDREDLAARPTSNLAAWDAYLKGMEIVESEGYATRPAVARFEQATALDPGFVQAWARSSQGHSFLFAFYESSPQDGEAARKDAERAFELAPTLPLSSMALAHYHAYVRKDEARATELFSLALRTAPGDVELLLGAFQIEQRWDRRLELVRRAKILDPRSMRVQEFLAVTLVCTRRTDEARAAIDRGLAVGPARLTFIQGKVMISLQDGNLAGARAAIAAVQGKVDPTVLVAFFGANADLDWVLDEAERDLLLRLTPAAFRDDRAAWGLTLARAWSRRTDTEKVREYAEEARKSFAASLAQDPRNAQNQALLGLSLAYLGRKDEAVREGQKAVALRPMIDSWEGTYVQHQLVRIHILCGNHERAIDLLEPLLRVHCKLTPGWLRIDPNFDPLRGNPRFEKLCREGRGG